MNGLGVGLGGSLQYSLYCTRYARKRDVSFQKRLYGNLVGGVKCNAMSAAPFRSLIGKAQAGKTGEVRRLEIQLAESSHIEAQIGLDALWITHRVENRQPHIGHGNLRQEAAVDVFDQ